MYPTKGSAAKKTPAAASTPRMSVVKHLGAAKNPSRLSQATAARKTTWTTPSSGKYVARQREDTNDSKRFIINSNFVLEPRLAARKRFTTPKVESDSEESDESSPPSSEDESTTVTPNATDVKMQEPPPAELLAALDSMFHLVPVPFLRRNLGRGFLLRCAERRVRTRPPPGQDSHPTIDVIYIYHALETGKRSMHSTVMHRWYCPLCDWHKPFPVRDMLLHHLSRDHDEVVVECHQVHIVDLDEPLLESRSSWRLQISLPRRQNAAELASPLPQAKSAISEPAPENNIVQSSTPTRVESIQSPSPTLQSEVEEITEVESRLLSNTPASRSSYEPRSVSRSHDIEIHTQTEAFSSLRLYTPSPGSDEEEEGPPELPESWSSRHGRSCTPPPEHDKYGPACRKPYLPFRSLDGGPNMYYSCRPGGPRIYDLLCTLSMEKFGVLANDILDQEEVILENECIQDELKVMHALWARWMRLNRNTFIANYCAGTKAFVEEYWKIIHYAAGFVAFRNFLIMTLILGRYINDIQLVDILKLYQEKTQMSSWYK